MKGVLSMTLMGCLLTMISNDGFASVLNLGPEEIVEANGVDIEVPGYSVPSFVDWDNDGKKDLVVGEGGIEGDYTYPGKVRVYMNVGTESNPQFTDYFYAQSDGVDLTCPASGSLGCFPRVVYWSADTLKDLLVGQADGTAKIFLNTGTEEDPTFDGGAPVQVNAPASDFDVGDRATPVLFWDWNNDDMPDLVAGGLDGKIHIYLNCGCPSAIPPWFHFSPVSGDLAQDNGSDLVVPSLNSSPVVLDLDDDGKKDLLTGNTNGQLLFYRNVGSDEDPNFLGYSPIDSNGVPIDLPGTPHSSPFVCDWMGDGYLDVLIGAGDGKVHLYQSIPQPGDIDNDYDVDLVDFALFAAYWQRENCDGCGGADFNGDGKVDIDDLVELLTYWLEAANL
jgi:hypothetical protein